MYGSVNSWVTAGSSSAPIFTSEAFTSSLRWACQNWYTQPRLSLASNTSVASAASRRSNSRWCSGAKASANTGLSGLKTCGSIRAANFAASSHLVLAPRFMAGSLSCTSASQSSSDTAAPGSHSSKWFSARKRANNIWCQC